MKKRNFLFGSVTIVFLICACRKENDTNQLQPDYASFSIGDKTYYLGHGSL
jgi:hypothetical protein